MKTKKTSLAELISAVENQANSKEFDMLSDLLILKNQAKILKPHEFIKLLDSLIEKYQNEETYVHAALMAAVQNGDVQAIKLYKESCAKAGGGEEVQIIDDL